MLYLLKSSSSMGSLPSPSLSAYFRQTQIPTYPTTSFSSKYLSVSSSQRANLYPEQGETTQRKLRPGKIRWLNLSMLLRGGRQRNANKLYDVGGLMGYICTAKLLLSRKCTVWQSPPAFSSPLRSKSFLNEWWFWPSPFSQRRFTRSEYKAGGSISANLGGSITTVLCSTSRLNSELGGATATRRPIPPYHTPPSSRTSNARPCTHDSQYSLNSQNTPIFQRTWRAWASIQRVSILSLISSQFCVPLRELIASRSLILFFMLASSKAIRLRARVRYWFCCSLRYRTPNKNERRCLASSTPSQLSSLQIKLIELTSDSHQSPSSTSYALSPAHLSL